jgi:hypothetical protein
MPLCLCSLGVPPNPQHLGAPPPQGHDRDKTAYCKQTEARTRDLALHLECQKLR